MPFALLMLAAACNMLPEYIASWAGWSVGAVEYAAYGIEAAVLWWVAASLLGTRAAYEKWLQPWLHPTQLLCCWGIFEAMQRPACRLMFAMTAPPPPHPKGLCAAAGIPTYYLTPLLLLCILLWYGHVLTQTAKE